MNVYKDWKTKLESAYYFTLKYYKITVWHMSQEVCAKNVSSIGL